jgi:DNA-directed RNA polymerase specialized sigma24 family protein
MGNTRRRYRGQKIGSKKRRRYRRIWSTLFTNRYQALFSYARKLTHKTHMQACDVVQEVFLRLWESVPNPGLISNHGAYMSSIVRNVVHSPKPDLEEVQMDDALETHPDLITEADLLDILEFNDSVMRIAMKIKENKKKGKSWVGWRRLQLFIQGYSIAEIAAILNEKEAQTRYRLSVFRAARAAIGERDQFSMVSVTKQSPVGSPIRASCNRLSSITCSPRSLRASRGLRQHLIRQPLPGPGNEEAPVYASVRRDRLAN